MAIASKVSPAKQLEGFLAKYSPEMRKNAKGAIAKMRKLLPGAVELVYDNYQWLVIGFSPTEKPSHAVFSLALAPRWITLCILLNGAKIPDPEKLLKGSGSRVRNVRLMGGANDLDRPAIKDLIHSAVKLAGNPYDENAPRLMIIRAVAARQRPRRPEPGL